MSEIHKNLFIENAELYDCTLWRYQIGHSEMLIKLHPAEKIYDESDILYLLLIGVEYFAGPIRWQGTNFQLGSKDELLSVLHQLGMTKSHLDDPEALQIMTELFDLFEVITSTIPVRIVAQRIMKFSYGEAPDCWHNSSFPITQQDE